MKDTGVLRPQYQTGEGDEQEGMIARPEPGSDSDSLMSMAGPVGSRVGKWLASWESLGESILKENRMLRRIMCYLSCSLLLCFSLPLHAAPPDPPSVFDSIDVDSSEAFQFAKACVPSVTEASFDRMARDVLANKSNVTRPVDKTQPYLVVSGTRVFCVKMSDRKYPILPLTAFDETVSFPGMTADEQRRFRIDLSRQIAANGFATALVANEIGNAVQVVYMLASEMPVKFYYHTNFLKKGEFKKSDFPAFYTAAGGMNITARGEPQENMKMLFSKTGS